MPFIVNPDFYHVLKDGTLNITAPGALGNDFSTVGTVTTPVLLDGPDHGTYSGALVDGTFQYTPNAGFTGIDTITISVFNGIVSKNSIITIEVLDPNDPRGVVTYPNFYNVPMNGVADMAAPGYLDNDFTVSGTLTTPVLLDGPDHGTWTALVNGKFTYTPTANFIGVDTVTVSVTNGTVTVTEVVTFNVYGANDAPSLFTNIGLTVLEELSGVLGAARLDFNDDDNADAQITYTLTAATANGTLFNNGSALGIGGTFTQADINTGLVSYTHNGGETTSDSFSFDVSDGVGGTTTGQSFAFTITPQNDPLAITSNGGGATANVVLPENETAVTTVTSTDPDGPAPTFSIVGGSDAARFQINAATGALSFVTRPNFELPADSDANNSYVVQVRASDGSFNDEQTITVNITNVVAENLQNDFNGDGKGDILFQNTNGTAAVWLLDGVNVAAVGGPLPNSGSSWKAKDSADFNGDGKSDILWQNDNGTAGVWLMDGTSVLQIGGGLPNPGPSWKTKEAADFNGDGKADILWQNDNGTAGVWLMNGTGVQQIGGALPNPGASWHTKAAADFNGDGKADILWQNDDGTTGVWLMDGTNVLQVGGGLNPGSAWHAEAAGDFNGDGKADILWQHTDGTTAVWLMDGTTVLSVGGALVNPGPTWHVKEAIDTNADGKADILWQNDNGTPGVWLMNGTSVLQTGGALANPGSAWHIV